MDELCYVICGDATLRTMALVNNYFINEKKKFNKNIMVTLPHHGSRTTGLGVSAAENAANNAKSMVVTFSGILKSKTITASAYDKHHHPSLEVIQLFVPQTTPQPVLKDSRLGLGNNVHKARANIDNKLVFNSKEVESKYTTFNTNKNLFTTNYSGLSEFEYNFTDNPYAIIPPITPNIPINEFACWIYTTDKNLNTTLAGKENLYAAPFTTFLKNIAVRSMGIDELTLNAIPEKVSEATPETEPLTRSSRPALTFSPANVRPAALPARVFTNRLKTLR